jgi:hypothetical protein
MPFDGPITQSMTTAAIFFGKMRGYIDVRAKLEWWKR